MRDSRWMERSREVSDAQESVHRGADHRYPQTGRCRTESRRGLSRAWHQRRHLLPLEGAIRWLGSERVATAATRRRRESQVEADRRGPDARQSGTEGPCNKKLVTPTARRRAVGYLREEYRMSERRA